MFSSWKIRRMLKKSLLSISVPAKEKVLPEHASKQKEYPVTRYSIENTTIKSKHRKIVDFAKVAVTVVLTVSLFSILVLNIKQANENMASSDPTNQNAFSEHVSAITSTSAQSEASEAFNPVNEEILKDFQFFCSLFDVNFPINDYDITRVTKFIRLKGDKTVYDLGIRLKCDNYNGKIISYGKDDIFVSYGTVYSKNEGYIEFCYVNISSDDVILTFPLELKLGDSLSDVLRKLNATDKYLKACSNNNIQNKQITLMKSTITSDTITLTFHEDENNVYESFQGDLTITYQTTYNNNIYDKNNVDKYIYEMSINITSGKVSSFYISKTGTDKNKTIEIDKAKDLTFYYDNSDFCYDNKNGVYAKIKKITINDQRAIITYNANADKETIAVIEYVVYNNGDKSYNKIYQKIAPEEREYTITINDCFEKIIELRIDNIGFIVEHSDYIVTIKNADLSTNEPTKEDKQFKEILSVFNSFYKAIDLPGVKSKEILKEKAKSIQFVNNKTLFDNGVYFHYDNYNGNGIVYGKENNKIGYERYDRYLSVYLMISEETKNIEYPFNFKLGTSLQEVLETLNYIDQYKFNENNNIYEEVEGIKVPKKFVIYANNETKELLHLSYHTVNSIVTDKSLEKGNVTIQYEKGPYRDFTYNFLTDTVKLIFKEGKLKYIYVGYHVTYDYLIPYDSSQSISFHFENNEYSYSSETGIYVKLKTIEVSGKTLKITFITKTATDKKCKISVMLLASSDLVKGLDSTLIDIQAGEHEYTYSYTVTNQDDNSPLTFNGIIEIGGNHLDFDLNNGRIAF